MADDDITLQVKSETTIPVIPRRLTQAVVDNFVMSGTLSSMSEDNAVEQRIYALSEESCWNVIAKTEDGSQVVYPYHAFIQATKSDMPSCMQIRLVSEDNPTGIENVEINEGQSLENIYDIYGRRVFEINTPGVYIVNGKKVFVK